MGRTLGRLLLAGTMLLAGGHAALADTFRTMTSAWVMGDLAVANGSAWVATGGGLLKVSPNGSQELFNSDAGFPSVRASSLNYDENSGYLWISYEDAYISIFDPSTEKIASSLGDFHENTSVESVVDIAVGDTLVWVISKLTLSSLAPVPDIPGRYVVKQTYRQFGGWPTGTTFSKLAIYDGAIIIGGPSGILRGDLTLDLLNSSNWEFISWSADLGVSPDADTDVSLLEVSNGRLFLSGPDGTWEWVDGAFTAMSTGEIGGVIANPEGDLIVSRHDGLWTASSSGTLIASLTGPDPIHCKAIGQIGALYFAATSNNGYFPGGLLVVDGDQLDLLYPDTPLAEGAQAIATLENGDIIVAGNNAEQAAISRYDGLHWQHYLNAEYLNAGFSRYAAYSAIVEDGQGAVWIGTSGNGVHVIAPLPGGQDTVVHYDKYNSTLSSFESTDNYVIVPGILPDPSGGLWLTNALTRSGVLMHYVPKSWLEEDVTTRDATDWISFEAYADDIPDNRLGRMVMDASGRIWIGYPRLDTAGNDRPPKSDQPSLVMFDPAGTPEDKSDDTWESFEWDEFDFASNLALDDAGLLWLSTEVGLFWIDTNLPASQISPTKVSATISEFIMDVEVDPLDQVWATTDFGVAVLGRDRYSWIRRYTTEEGPYPSPLVEANVNAMTFSPSRGEAWLATTNTLTIVTTPYRAMGGELGDIEVAPQPFYVGPDESPLTFSTQSLVSGASVRIYTVSGRFIRELSFDEAVLEGWDGRDDEGEWVASGVYMILVTDPSGESGVGKAAVIRR